MPSLDELRARYDSARVQAFYATGSVPAATARGRARHSASGRHSSRVVPDVDRVLEVDIAPAGPGIGGEAPTGTYRKCAG